jgi:predicted N-formylglutamate amidohydrolase
VRDRDFLDQRVTLEIWLPGRHTVLAHASHRELGQALIEVRKAAIREIEDEAERR